MASNFKTELKEFFQKECPELFLVTGPISDHIFFESLGNLVNKIPFNQTNFHGFGYDLNQQLLNKLDICFGISIGTQFPEIDRDGFENEFAILEHVEYNFKKIISENLMVKFLTLKNPKTFHRIRDLSQIDEILFRNTDKTIIPVPLDSCYHVVLRNQREQAIINRTCPNEDYADFIPSFPSKEVLIGKSIGTQTINEKIE